ncbi:hypothetical protein SEA_LILMARTIN_247 [Streptomyces phage LilMartin]|nr:hypothetical protein SEA_LILMARTIN_247 [Streptomyces phage LilMartin]QNO12634.1 hypothetical protein SEA_MULCHMANSION_251 [Streptomyces phage MulchMansion]UVK61302.1 hypothetical protein SEA_ANGELA_251 [Streptomyces phage Angela]
MVKRMEITYIGGVKETIQYDRIARDTEKERIYVDSGGRYITVIKDKILQMKEL